MQSNACRKHGSYIHKLDVRANYSVPLRILHGWSALTVSVPVQRFWRMWQQISVSLRVNVVSTAVWSDSIRERKNQQRSADGIGRHKYRKMQYPKCPSEVSEDRARLTLPLYLFAVIYSSVAKIPKVPVIILLPFDYPLTRITVLHISRSINYRASCALALLNGAVSSREGCQVPTDSAWFAWS